MTTNKLTRNDRTQAWAELKKLATGAFLFLGAVTAGVYTALMLAGR